MNRRIVSVITAVLGLVVIALAVCSATVWRPSATATASLSQEPDQSYVLVEPGVLGLVGSDVTVTATAEGQDVLIAVGYSADARAWLADDPYVSVTGLTDWTTLSSTSVTERCAASTTETAAPAEATEVPEVEETASASGCTPLTASGADPAGSVLWQSTVTGEGTATVELDATDSDLVVLLATDGASTAPALTLSWPRAVDTPFFVPGLVLGGLLLLAGTAGVLLDLQMRRADEERRRRAAERAARLASADSVPTTTLPVVGDPNRPLTRREQRDKERAEAAGEEWNDPRTATVLLDGVAAAVPVVSGTGASTPVPEADVEAASAPRGAAVVPGLDEQATAAHRATRDLDDDAPFSLAPEADVEAASAPCGAAVVPGLDEEATVQMDAVTADDLRGEAAPAEGTAPAGSLLDWHDEEKN